MGEGMKKEDIEKEYNSGFQDATIRFSDFLFLCNFAFPT
jgi:hypothetical protein